ncbi:unnamed protein product, partial [Mesorhabditis belari]|uniref:Uncharacterized protein n=1 Tax=Mesorhabditis belari TaxID=2138241 RepID=A0AAF3FHJ4_9BILA
MVKTEQVQVHRFDHNNTEVIKTGPIANIYLQYLLLGLRRILGISSRSSLFLSTNVFSVLLNPVGDAPILKKRKYAVDPSRDIAWKMMGLVDYDSESGSDEESKTLQPQRKNISAAEDGDFFSTKSDNDGDNECTTNPAPLFDEDEKDLDDVVKPKAWEKALAEKTRRKLEKKAEKKKRKDAKASLKEAQKSETSIVREAEPKTKKRPQIALFGALNMAADPGSDSEEEETKPGPSGLAQPGAKGLLGMLPPPSKMAATKPAKKPTPAPAVTATTTIKKKPLIDDQDSDSDDEAGDFFGLTSSAPSAKMARLEDQSEIPMMPSGGLEEVVGPMRPAANEYVHPSEMYNMANFEMEAKRKGIITDQEAHRLILQRESDFGMGVSDIVSNIQDFSVEQALGPNVHAQLLRNITKQQHAKSTAIPLPKVAGVRDINAKRKNQITYLAQMAVAREEALQDARADSKHTKRMARQKYGF